ncbi:MAG: uroporphyrinogen-III C-methyltransferase [Chitinophagaceae bacterium]|nr:MAG: uroporphyrinogen-III C-methyltransferase [Chitinophagaceae bacterium]
MQIPRLIGKVVLAGAGPGDPELISVKAVRWLQKADVVLTDRLVSPEILSEYVNPGAEIICVGKQGRYGSSTPQKKINQLMVEHSLNGRTVVRLKGGDVSVFGNLLDELQTLVENNIPYEIIPGISAAFGAAAYAGIPLTARNYSNAIRFLTFYKTDVLEDKYWKDLAATDDTLVFYMSTGTLHDIVENLQRHGITSDKYMAVVEQATTRLQNVHVANLYRYKEEIGHREFASPSLLIIGKVVALHEQFSWIRNSNSQEPYFDPIESLQRAAV